MLSLLSKCPPSSGGPEVRGKSSRGQLATNNHLPVFCLPITAMAVDLFCVFVFVFFRQDVSRIHTIAALCVWIATPDIADFIIIALVLIVTFGCYRTVPLREAISAIAQDIKDFHQSEYRSLKSTLRLGRKCVLTLVEPVVGTGFVLFVFFLTIKPVLAEAYTVKYVGIVVFFLYRFFRIWQSYRRLRKGTNAM